MAWNESALTGRFSYKKPSLYNLAKTAGEERLNIAYDYRNEIISRNISKHLLRVPIIYYFSIYLNESRMFCSESYSTVLNISSFKYSRKN